MSAHLMHVPTKQTTQMLVTDDWMFAFAAKKPFESRARVIFDTGTSLAITPNQHDFVEPPTSLSRPMTLGGMANDLEIKGIGTVAWTFDAADGSEIQLLTQAYLVQNSNARLLSPQKLFNKALLDSIREMKKTSALSSMTIHQLIYHIHGLFKSCTDLCTPVVDSSTSSQKILLS
jgi:hypothetical protein